MRRNARGRKSGRSRNQKFDNARRLRGVHFIDPGDEEFKDIMKNARRKLEVPMPAAVPRKTPINSGGETHCSIVKINTKHACIVEADESMRKRMEVSPHKNHEDHIAGKGMTSLSHHNLVPTLIPMLQATKIPDAKGSSGERMGKLEKIPAWQLTKVRNKNEVITEARNEGRKVHFASLMDLCHLKNSELEPQFQKYKARVVLRGDIVKDDSGSCAVFTEQGSSASQMAAAKVVDILSRLPGCAGQAADAVSAYTQVKMEDAPSLLKIAKSECPDIWIRLPKHTWPKSWSRMADPLVPLERNLYGHPLAGLLLERQFEKVLLEHGWKNFQIENVHSLTREKGLFLSVNVDDINKIGWKEAKYQSDVEDTHERRSFGRTNIIP